MKRILVVIILVAMLAVLAMGCTRNNTPGNTISPVVTEYPATPTAVPGTNNTPGAIVSPTADISPGTSPGTDLSPGTGVSPETSPGMNATISPKASPAG